ncbi:Zinc finger and SCAN domain-containing protein 29 [Chelonia mydas]|uniref:Zinc finger and SCAN domain-containing protein 29 n=1 Tax=Chelonia mydas TaxID=8469 RepID=M7AVD7_CHEMY|nr:Zinc finger and SCAN domain-containing protein 29 [Chelonia mydas]
MFLGTISANEGDTVSGRCLIPAGAPVSIVFFCKDGMEISRLQARRGKFSYDLAYSVAGSSGNISCGYMSRNDNNQVLKSLLSVARYLKVTGLENDTILAITIPVLVGVILALVLPLVYYLKKKKVVTKRRKESVVSSSAEVTIQSSSAQVTMMESQNHKRAPAWTEREVLDLIAVWGDESVLSELRSKRRNAKIFEKISKGMKDRGYNRDLQQCRVKLKELRQAYQRTREANGRSGSEPQTCRFYDELHAILGDAPTTTPALCVYSLIGLSRNRDADFGDEEDEEEVEAQQASRETVFPDSQELFLTLDLVPSQLTEGGLPDLEGGEGTSGDLPAPELFLDKSSAYVGDTVLYRCLTPSDAPVSFAFLCKDGKEMSRKPAVPGKLSFDFPHHVSGQSSGNYSCGYQHKGLHNQVQSSHLSIVRYLSVTGVIATKIVYKYSILFPDASSIGCFDEMGSSSYLKGQGGRSRGAPGPLNSPRSPGLLLLPRGAGGTYLTGSDPLNPTPSGGQSWPQNTEYKIAVTKAGALKISQTTPQGNKYIEGSYESLNAITMEDTPYSTLPMMDVSALPTSEHPLRSVLLRSIVGQCLMVHILTGMSQILSLKFTVRIQSTLRFTLAAPNCPMPAPGERVSRKQRGSLVKSQEICSSPGTLPTPRLFLERLSARQGDTAVLSCLVPLDTPMTRIVFCKEGKEFSVQPKEGNKLVYDSPHPVSRESSGAFSCHYQLMDDNNQENNSLPSDARYLHVAGVWWAGGRRGSSPSGEYKISRQPHMPPSAPQKAEGCHVPMLWLAVWRELGSYPMAMEAMDVQSPAGAETGVRILQAAEPGVNELASSHIADPLTMAWTCVPVQGPGEEPSNGRVSVGSGFVLQRQAQTSSQGVSGCRAAILPCAGQQQTMVSVLPLGKCSMAQTAHPAPSPVLLWVCILHSTLVLLLLVSAPIITCIVRKRAIAQHIQKALQGNGRDKEEGEVAEVSEGSRCPGQVGGSAAARPDQRATAFLSLRRYGAEPKRRCLDPRETDAAVALPDCGVIMACPHDPAVGPMASLKDGKEISVQPKEGNKFVYDSPYPVSSESAGAFSCRYQLKDDNNQENNSLSSDSWNLHVAGDESSPTPCSSPGGGRSHSREPDAEVTRAGADQIRCGEVRSDSHRDVSPCCRIPEGLLRFSPLLPMILPLGLCLLCDLPAPTLILDKGSAHHGDTVILLCFVPMDTSVTRIIFCKGGKEISILPKDGNKFIYIYESAQPASPDSTGEYSCRYQHKDNKNQEKNSLPSARRHLSAPDGPSPSWNNNSGGEPSPPGSDSKSIEVNGKTPIDLSSGSPCAVDSLDRGLVATAGVGTERQNSWVLCPALGWEWKQRSQEPSPRAQREPSTSLAKEEAPASPEQKMGDSGTSSSTYSQGASSPSVGSHSPEAEGSLFAETPSAQLEEEDVSPEQATTRVIQQQLQGRDEWVQDMAKQLCFLHAVPSLCFSAQRQGRNTLEPHFLKVAFVESTAVLHKTYSQSLDTMLRSLLTETPTMDKLQHFLEHVHFWLHSRETQERARAIWSRAALLRFATSLPGFDVLVPGAQSIAGTVLRGTPLKGPPSHDQKLPLPAAGRESPDEESLGLQPRSRPSTNPLQHCLLLLIFPKPSDFDYPALTFDLYLDSGLTSTWLIFGL